MKFGIDCRLLDKKTNSGISRYTEFLIKYYCLKFGDKSVLLVTNDKNFSYNNLCIAYTRLKPYNIFDLFLYSNFISKLKLNAIHIPFYSSFLFKNNTTITIITAHDLMYRLVKNFFSKNIFINYFKRNYFDILVRQSLKNADYVISVSKTTQADISTCFGIESIHIPEDSSIDEDIDSNILLNYNLKFKSYYFYCGNNRPHKNIGFLKKVFEENLNLPILVLAGSGHVSAQNVLNLGIVTEAELKALYKNAIAFVFPSKYEGFGLPILESIRLQTLVVASRISAFLEFKSKNIYYFDSDNTIELYNILLHVKSCKFQEDLFLEKYDVKYIYKLYDQVINKLNF